MDKELKDHLIKTSESIRHCGDYGTCSWHEPTKTVHWSMGDADGDGIETDASSLIESKFKDHTGVKHVIFGNESPAPDDFEDIDYDRSINHERRKSARTAKSDADNSNIETVDSSAASDSEADIHDDFFCENQFSIVGDSLSGKTLRVRQLYAIADRVNGNGRVLPRAELQTAVDKFMTIVRAGAAIGNHEHPDVGRNKNGAEEYFDYPDRNAIKILDIEPIKPNGEMWGTHETLDTPLGQEVKAAYLTGKGVGTSLRYKCGGTAKAMGDGRFVHVAKPIVLRKIDTTTHPAVFDTATSWQCLSDSELESLGMPVSQSQNEKEKPKMNEAFKRALSQLRQRYAQRAPVADINLARKACVDAAINADIQGEDTTDLYTALDELDAKIKIPGYDGGPGLTAVNPTKSGEPGYAEDLNRNGAGQSVRANEGDIKDPDERDKTTIKPEITAKTRSKATTDSAIEALRAAGFDPDLLKASQEREVKAREDEAKAKADSENKGKIIAALDSLLPQIEGLKPVYRDHVKTSVLAIAKSPDDVEGIFNAQVDSLNKIVAAERMASKGAGEFRNYGQTVYNPASPEAQDAAKSATVDGRPAYLKVADKILAACDNHMRAMRCDIDPDDSVVKSVRKANMPFIEQMWESFQAQNKANAGVNNMAAAFDSQLGNDEDTVLKALSDGVQNAWDLAAKMDATAVSSLANMPVMARVLLVQQFQDLSMLQYVDGIGPGVKSNGEGWYKLPAGTDAKIGTVLNILTETYAGGTGYATNYGATYDAGFLVPEGTGIDPISINTAIYSIYPLLRSTAISATREAILQPGDGPFNYDTVARLIYHMTYAKNRTIDQALGNEFIQAADEFGAIAVANETVTLANNSVYGAGGSIVVNLNPAKNANTTPVIATPSVAGDDSMTYGANVIGAVRLKCGGTGTTGDYFGLNGLCATPIVMPRTKISVSTAGAVTYTTINPLTISAPGAAVAGIFDSNYQVQPTAAQQRSSTTPTYAVDWENGVIAFSSGVTGTSGGILSTTVTVSAYSYATNFDAFQVNNVVLSTGVTQQQYNSGILTAIDNTCATMGSSPNYVKPNLILGNLKAITTILSADVFYNWASPRGTVLFPSETFFAERNGVNLARHNTPWRCGSHRLIAGRRGATKYGIDRPYEIKGPYPFYDTANSGNITNSETYYGYEYSAIGTPQTLDTNGKIVNGVYRSLLLY